MDDYIITPLSNQWYTGVLFSGYFTLLIFYLFSKTDLTKLVKDSINNAPKMGHYVPGGKGYCAIFEIKYKNIKPVYVVWNMLINCAATVLTKEMYVNYHGK